MWILEILGQTIKYVLEWLELKTNVASSLNEVEHQENILLNNEIHSWGKRKKMERENDDDQVSQNCTTKEENT